MLLPMYKKKEVLRKVEHKSGSVDFLPSHKLLWRAWEHQFVFLNFRTR